MDSLAMAAEMSKPLEPYVPQEDVQCGAPCVKSSIVLQMLLHYNREQGELNFQPMLPRMTSMSDVEKDVFFRTMVYPPRTISDGCTM